MRNPCSVPLVVLLIAALAPGLLEAQAGSEAVDAYYEAIGRHFDVSSQEVRTLSEWGLTPEEVPVVLYIARRGGIASDAVVALRRGGEGWSDLARRYGVGAEEFHVRMARAVSGGSLVRAYERYGATPTASWSGIDLSDAEVVGLVNLRVLSEAAGLSPERVLSARDQAGSWVSAFRSLAPGG